ncbi:hypothetical protein VNI00_004266 [Paramarasmius palmivorus]|uniref:Cytochrome P450 n=1 Tax=Paramarasmius palmivorus TaxID=297713 RepID=A0AAW0DK89_9AGAR
MSIAYGIKVKSESDPWVALAEEAIGPLMRATVPGAFLVDTFPFLKYIPSWFPGAGFKRQAREWRKLTMRLKNEPFVEGKRIIESGEYTPSFISESLQRLDELEDPLVQAGRKEKENLIRDTAGTMYLAGVDSTATAITSFLYSMVTHPDIQRQAQAEVDRVVVGRLPTFKDEKSLPYVTALVWEVLRWKSVSPLGLAHYLESEDVYEGYRIPKGSVVVSNIWAILHDEEIYIDPFKFSPERYFKPGSRVFDETVKDPTFAVFGFGRRICPGRHMAYASIWIAVASILKTFDISKKVDEKGNVVEPVYEQQTAIVA